jgi:hypothetical protein
MATQNKLNNYIFRHKYGKVITNPKYITAYLGAQAAGNSDLYTCPANKRAYVPVIIGMTSNGSAAVARAQIKHGGTYYPIGGTFTCTATAGIISTSGSPILEAGDIISVVTTGVGSANLWATVIEFDNTSSIKSHILYTIDHTQTVTLYTVPANKTALIMNYDGTWPYGGGSGIVYNGTGSSLTAMKVYAVPSGLAADETTRLNPTSSLATGTTRIVAAAVNLQAGDTIQINTSAAASDAVTAWFNVIEM